MSPGDVADAILLVGPGFIFWKAAYFSGAQHKRLEWEWIVWSVLVSLPIAGATAAILAVGARTGLPAPVPPVEEVSRFVVAAALGGIFGLAWQATKASANPKAQRFERQVRDSAWDLVLDEASEPLPSGKPRYGVQVTIEVSGKHQSYYGAVDAFGYEGADAERWLFLRAVDRWWPDPDHPEGGAYRRMARTRGMLIHADKILRLRVIEEGPVGEPKA